MKTVKLENWAVCFLPQDTWGAAFADVKVPGRLHGTVSGHDRIEDGELVTTTPMIKAEGRLITTDSGTVYELGTVKEDYAEFTRTMPGKEDWDFDGDTPIVIHQASADLSDEKQAELNAEQDRIKGDAMGEIRLAIMPTADTKH